MGDTLETSGGGAYVKRARAREYCCPLLATATTTGTSSTKAAEVIETLSIICISGTRPQSAPKPKRHVGVGAYAGARSASAIIRVAMVPFVPISIVARAPWRAVRSTVTAAKEPERMPNPSGRLTLASTALEVLDTSSSTKVGSVCTRRQSPSGTPSAPKETLSGSSP